MTPTFWEIYLFADATVFSLISFYAIIKLILSYLHNRLSYCSQTLLRSLAFSLAVSLSFIFLVIYFHSNDIGNDIYHTLIIFISNAICIAFFFSILEWDSICRQIPFIACQKNPIFIICISIIGVTGLCQLSTYYIRTKASPFVFFFCNNFALFVQMEFILANGSIFCGITLRTLDESTDHSFSKYIKVTSFTFGVMLFVTFFFFICFLASFCVPLENSYYYNLFSALCCRLPRVILLISSLLLQDLMDITAAKSIILQSVNSEALV